MMKRSAVQKTTDSTMGMSTLLAESCSNLSLPISYTYPFDQFYKQIYHIGIAHQAERENNIWGKILATNKRIERKS